MVKMDTIPRWSVWLAEKQHWHLSLMSYLQIFVGNITAAFYCTGWDTPNPGGWDLTAAERQNVTHTNTHSHCISTCTYRHTIQESILINAGLALNTEGLSEPPILPLQLRVCACMCIREIVMGRAKSVTAVSGFHSRARAHVFPQCEGC